MTKYLLPAEKMPALSVIVILYNSEKYLRECLDSIVNQIYRDFELILVDDGSTDNSGKICDEYQEKYADLPVRVIHKENRGMLHSRYTGVKNARGRYVTFVDSDDLIDRDMFSDLMAIADDTGCDIVMCSVKSLRADGSISIPEPLPFEEGFYDKLKIREKIYPAMIWDINKKKCFLPCGVCMKIIKRDIVLPVYENLKESKIIRGEDKAVSIPCIVLSSSFYYTGKNFYTYRQSGNLSKYTDDPRYFDRIYSLYVHLRSFLDRTGLLPELEKSLDCYYMNMLNSKPGMNNSSAEDKYLFPFGKVKKDGNIILYGAGRVGKSFYRQISKTSYCNVILWTDTNWQYHQDDSFVISPVSSIMSASYDQIVVCVANKIERKKILDDLIGMGIDKNKIVCDYEL